MIEYENECVNCGFSCMGIMCPHHRVPHFYCDECDEETDIYEYDGEQLCIDCIKDKLEKVSE